MKKFIGIAVVVYLSGCADTPQNRELWRGIASGMQSGAQEMNRQTEQMRNSLNQQSQQQYTPQIQRPTNCITQYNSLTREYITTCN